MSSFSVTILGSNSALPTSERYPTAQIVRVSERFFLVDCGEGTQMQMRKHKINFSKIDSVFISHLHGDHCFGLIGLISTLGLLGRNKPLYLYAHADLEKILVPQLAYFCDELPYEVKFVHLSYDEPVVIYEDKNVIVKSLPLAHRIPTCGFIFQEKEKQPNIRKEAIFKYELSIKEIASIKRREAYYDASGELVSQDELIIEPPKPRSYAFCSDTRYYRKIIPYIQEVNLLYHEATFLHELKTLAKSSGHTTVKQAATIAKDAQVGKLILGHFSNRYRTLNPLLQEAKEVFENSVLVKDGEVFSIEN